MARGGPGVVVLAQVRKTDIPDVYGPYRGGDESTKVQEVYAYCVARYRYVNIETCKHVPPKPGKARLSRKERNEPCT